MQTTGESFYNTTVNQKETNYGSPAEAYNNVSKEFAIDDSIDKQGILAENEQTPITGSWQNKNEGVIIGETPLLIDTGGSKASAALRAVM